MPLRITQFILYGQRKSSAHFEKSFFPAWFGGTSQLIANEIENSTGQSKYK
jgi:hypothetical protein